jgi:hypothetical protein
MTSPLARMRISKQYAGRFVAKSESWVLAHTSNRLISKPSEV